MLEIVLSILKTLLNIPAEYLANPIKKQVSFLCCYNSNAQTLIQEDKKLDIARQTVQQQVDAAQRNLEDIRPDVADWLKRANEIKTTSHEVLIDAENYVQKGCLSKRCPFLRYSSSREAKKTTDAIVELKNNGKFEQVADPTNPANLPPIPAASGIGFNSRDLIEKEIMDALKDDSVYLIGLCGMGGVGKTTMANKIKEEAKTKMSMFEVVVWATVSQPQDLKNVQQQIAEGVGLKLEEESEQIRAEKLHARLTNAKSFLIILDDVWEKIDLGKLGIPSQSTTEKRKLILTSRVRDALTSVNDPKILIMGILTEDEAWSLFREKAGESANAAHLRETAKEVAKECKGLPLALVVVGSALREKNEGSWKNALCQLKRSTVPANIPEMLHKVYVPLKWSYDQLENEEAQYIFLLCCLFPEDYVIDVETLVRYGWGLCIFSDTENLSEARDRVHGHVERLKLRFLLIRARDECVKMHDVIRDMAISIASKEGHVFRVNHNTEEWSNKKSYADYTHISVTLSRHFAPEIVDCLKLEFLRMELHWGNVKMPMHVFDSMRGVRVLELSRFISLPSSTFGLTNLRALHLVECELETTSLVGKIDNLEILDLRSSMFEELPKEIGQLKKLKLLDLTYCNRLREIAPGVISGLVNLEGLLMFDSFDEWEAEEDGNERKKASLAEVASLRKLVSLEIDIENPELASLETQKLERYCIRIGNFDISTSKEVYSKFRRKYKKIVLWESEEESPLRNFCPSMTRSAEYLKLEGDGCIRVINDLVAMQYPKGLNTNLKYLVLDQIDNITEIFNCQISKGNFSKLEVLKVYHCCNLRNILAPPVSRGLTSPTRLSLSICEELEEVIAQNDAQGGQKDVEDTMFPHLNELELSVLPKMKRFCHMTNALKLPSLARMIIRDCPMLETFSMGSNDSGTKFLFNKEVLFSNLYYLELEKIHYATGLFENRISIGNFSGLGIVNVESCYSLKNLFSPPTSRGLINLKELKLEDCKELEEVIAMGSQEGQRKIKETLFPKLETLMLIKLSKFHRFCHMAEDLELPSLRIITIKNCPEKKTFSLGSLHLPSLKYVYGMEDPILATKFFFNKEKCSKVHRDNTCFKLSARDLFPDKGFWQIYLIPDSTGYGLLPVAEWRGFYFTPPVKGKCSMANLSTAGAYEIFYVIMLKESTEGHKWPVKFSLTLPGGITQDRTGNLGDKPIGQWLEILGGEFRVEPNQIGDLEFLINFPRYTPHLLEGVIIRQKSK